MANGYTNGSYERCMAELRARYSGRGVSASAKRQTGNGEYLESDMSFSRVSYITNEYRSGSHNGNRYMTSDDFIRYFRNRSRYNMPLALRNAEITSKSRVNEGVRAVSPSRTQGAEKGALVKPDGTSKEGNLINKVESLAKEWLEIEPKEGREVGTKFKLPTRAIGSMAAFALSMLLIVSGSVMVGKASGELGTINSQISRLEARETELESQLDLKYNVQDIEKEASALGMIKNEFADKEYLEVAEEEKIEIFEEENKEFSFSALLSAFGIDID